MIRSYTMRLKVTKGQQKMLADLLEHLCVLYNCALAERSQARKEGIKVPNYYAQQFSLGAFRRSSPSVASFPVGIQRDPLRRVDKAFRGFFRRVQAKQAPGYPRFKSKSGYDSFSVDSANFRVEDDVVVVTKLGGFRFKTKYKMKGQPKLLTVKRCGARYVAVVACDIGEAPAKVTAANATGIDLGITSLITLSNGEEVANPRWTKREEARLAATQRCFSAKKKGSNNRTKAKERVRRTHQRITGLRNGYLTDVAKRLIGAYDLIAHEDLKISNMVRSNLAKSIMDAAWGKLIWRLNCEAEKAGKWVIPVNPRNTSQNCSGCGVRVPKELSDRMHICPCGVSLGRDHNAALNILALGVSAASKQNHISS